MQISLFAILALYLTCVHSLNYLDKATWKFQEFYPSYASDFRGLIDTTCNEQYQNYTRRINLEEDDKDCNSCYVQPLFDCMLRHSGELVKANMASAAVLLGLMPTVLALLSSTAVEFGLLAFRRPFLTFLLCAASPAISPFRSFQHFKRAESFEKLLKSNPNQPADQASPADQTPPADQAPPANQASSADQTSSADQASLTDQAQSAALSGKRQGFISLVEYSFALAAVLNSTSNVYQLTLRVVLVWDPQLGYTIFMWFLLSLAAHLGGVVLLSLLVKLRPDPANATISWTDRFCFRLQHEFQPSEYQPRATLKWRCEPDPSKRFLAFSWFTFVGSVAYVFWGTVVFSGTRFISVQDAMGVAGRFALSIFVCRVILVYELIGMLQVVVPDLHPTPSLPPKTDTSESQDT